MPCIILTGYPSSGKSTIAKLLRERALLHSSKSIEKVIIINEESLFSISTSTNNPRQQQQKQKQQKQQKQKTINDCDDDLKYQCYKDSNAEKQTRSALKTEFDKYASMSSTQKTLVILDSLNYIKGYRYELHCISKAFGERHAVVWIICPPNLALLWNQNRVSKILKEKEEQEKEDGTNHHQQQHHYYYSNELMEGLMRRYEPPDDRNRWDKPLYRVDLSTLLPAVETTNQTETEGTTTSNTTTSFSTESSSNNEINTKLNVGDILSKTSKNDSIQSVAKSVLEKSVYNMHSLSDAIDGTDTKKNNDSSDNSHDSNTPTSITSNPYPTLKSSSSSSSSYSSIQNQNDTQGTRWKTKNFTKTPQASSSSSPPLSSSPLPSHSDFNTTTLTNNPTDSRTKLEKHLDDILDAFLECKPLKEGMSTQKPIVAESNMLHQVDSITKKATTTILKAQQGIPPGGIIPIGNTKSISFSRRVNLPELRRLQRQYVKWITNHPPENSSEQGIMGSFLEYLDTRID